MTRKTAFFEGWSWFKFNNFGLPPGTNLKFYTSVAKGLKLKVRRFWGLIPTFGEVTGEKLVGGLFAPPPILNRVSTVFRVHIISAIVDCLSRLMLSNICCFFCFASSAWLSVEMFACLVMLVRDLKTFFTFATASAYFFPDAWADSAEHPEEDNSTAL